MNPTYPTDIKETAPSESSLSEESLEFASFMEEAEPSPFKKKKPDEDEMELSDLEENTPIIEGPYTAPLIPPLITATVSKLIASLPVEIQPLIEPLPAEIQVIAKSGILQTKLMIQLASDETVEVVIDQYDTAPSAFHISFYSSESTRDLISARQGQLLNVLQTALPFHSFAISPPFLEAPSFSLPKSKRFGYSPVNRGRQKK